MKKKLLAFIRANQRATFSEIEHFFEREHFEYRGDFSINLRLGSNIMLWDGWSHEAVGLIVELAQSGEVFFSAATWIEVMTLGKMFSVPLAKKPEHDYKDLRWLPVVVSAARIERVRR